MLGFAPSGDGEHDFLQVSKTGANTNWVARGLARHAGVSTGDVGYAGQKDRQAVTQQWFSVRRPTVQGTDWATFRAEGVQILDIARNRRKLRHGSHAGNRFRIAVAHAGDLPAGVEARLESIGTAGVPNYFGPQRFGRHGANLSLARQLFEGRRLRREERAHALSAARSLIFNEVLAGRVRRGTWNQVLPDDVLNHDDSNSLFTADGLDDGLRCRVETLDAHPTGPLWGTPDRDGRLGASPAEAAVARQWEILTRGLEARGARFGRRALRLAVRDLAWQVEPGRLVVEFRLRSGGYATAVLRELCDID